MNQTCHVPAKITRRVRSAFSRRAVRAATVAGLMALTVGTAGSALAGGG